MILLDLDPMRYRKAVCRIFKFVIFVYHDTSFCTFFNTSQSYMAHVSEKTLKANDPLEIDKGY